MNVPLKKRHNYGKINGSSTSLNEPSAKRLLSTYTNYEDSESEHPSSNMDDEDDVSSVNGPATMGYLSGAACSKKHQYLSMRKRAVPTDARTMGAPTVVSSSSRTNSSASNHESSVRKDVESSSSSDSDSSGSSNSSDNNDNLDDQGLSEPLTEESLIQHNTEFEPMNSKERVQFWNVADEFSEIEDDFDDKKYFSKPIRSERLQKRMYTHVPVFSTSRKSKKEEKSRKTDDKPAPSTATKKAKADAKEVVKTPPKRSPKKGAKSERYFPVKARAKSPALTVKSTSNQPRSTKPLTEKIQPLIQPVKPLVNNSIIETRPPDEIPSAIKFRVSYTKSVTNLSDSFRSSVFANGARANDSGGCANCSKHSHRLNETMSSTTSAELPVIANNNREEFYKYLGIDTKPPHEKISPEPSPTAEINALYNQRRSLRVFIQQRQNEFSTKINDKTPKDDKSPERQFKSPTRKNNSSIDGLKLSETSPANGPVGVNGVSPKLNGQITTSTDPISSHIKQRRSYEPNSSPDIESRRPDVCSQNGEAKQSPNAFKQTEITCDATATAATSAPAEVKRTKPVNATNGLTADNKIVRAPKRKVMLPSPMMLTEMFKRYKQCFKKGFAMRQHLRQQATKRARKRPLNNLTPRNASVDESKVDSDIATDNNAEMHPNDINSVILNCEHLINTFSPTSITHSNASTDSAIVINPNVNINDVIQPTITLNVSDSLQWQRDQINHIDKSKFQNPLNPKHGNVLAILTHSVSPEDTDVVVVVQESQISFWYSTSKVLSMFGVNRTWQQVGGIARLNEDIEVDALYQHRLIDLGEQFPVYVEMRAKESQPDEFRQSILTFVYLNVYFVMPDANGQPKIILERVHLDTLKGFANSIHYIALRSAPSVLMTWTEHNVNNQTRCGIIKYTLKTPTLDNIEEIVDYSIQQHDINTLFALNDYHVVGCGDRTISMWDHRNGNLLIDVEIELPTMTIGKNIGCYAVGDNVPEYMLLVQLASAEASAECDTQLKVMAVQTVNPYNWRTLQTHNIPNTFGKIRSIFNKDDLLTITFASGSMLILNISSPHNIYTRNVAWPTEQKKANAQLNCVVKNEKIKSAQLFAQSNGQLVEITSECVTTKSVWEYFIEKN